MEQSEALMEVERETRRRLRRGSRQSSYQETLASINEDALGSTPKQSDYLSKPEEDVEEPEPFWRRITRKLITCHLQVAPCRPSLNRCHMSRAQTTTPGETDYYTGSHGSLGYSCIRYRHIPVPLLPIPAALIMLVCQ